MQAPVTLLQEHLRITDYCTGSEQDKGVTENGLEGIGHD